MKGVLAVIPARSGSKGVLGKNLRSLAGAPLLTWSIEAAKAAVTVDDVVVSSDAVSILEVAAGAGARPFVRPPELATDTAPTDPVLVHVLDTMARRGEDLPDLVVLLQPTSPLRPPDLIDRAVRFLQTSEADSVFTAYRGHFVWQRERDGSLRCNCEPTHARPRRQSFAPYQERWIEDGSVYVTRTEVLLKTRNRLGGRVEMIENEWSPEIDTPFEFWMAEQIIRFRRETSGDLIDGILERMREGAPRAT